MTIVTFFLGLAALILGAKLLVSGASQLAMLFGVSELIVGLSIVAFGTSTPELLVAIQGVFTNHSDLIVGNCIGSTIFNILFIIGVCSILVPLIVDKQLIWLDVPIMIGAHVMLLFVSLNGSISAWGGLLLLSSFGLYYWFVIFKVRQENSSTDNNQNVSENLLPKSTFVITKQAALVIIGLIICIMGADWVVSSAVDLARTLGVSELIIGLTIVSIGTSLPEVTTSIVAIMRGQRDIAIGNVVGSCIFNILGVLGFVSLIAPGKILVSPSVLRFDLPVAIAACIACLPIFFTGHRISRWEGLLFLIYYLAYTIYLFLEANKYDALPLFSIAMVWFAFPLTGLTLGVIIYRRVRLNSQNKL